MCLTLVAVLLALTAPPGPHPTAGEPSVEPLPAVPEIPTGAAPPVPMPPLRALDAPSPSPPPAETVDETPAHRPLPPPVRPNAGFGFEIGYAHGGDRFLTVVDSAGGVQKGTDAGDGMFFSLAGDWTPYWSRRGVGLGVYVRAGAKLSWVSDNTTAVSFLRCPLAAGAQVLLPIAGRWYALGRLGALTEVFGRITATSAGVERTSADFSPRLGEFLDAGLYWTPAGFAGFGAIARYEWLDVSYGSGVTNANNLGALVAAYLRF